MLFFLPHGHENADVVFENAGFYIWCCNQPLHLFNDYAELYLTVYVYLVLVLISNDSIKIPSRKMHFSYCPWKCMFKIYDEKNYWQDDCINSKKIGFQCFVYMWYMFFLYISLYNKHINKRKNMKCIWIIFFWLPMKMMIMFVQM